MFNLFVGSVAQFLYKKIFSVEQNVIILTIFVLPVSSIVPIKLCPDDIIWPLLNNGVTKISSLLPIERSDL